MKYNRKQYANLVEKKATILINDGFEKNGTPIYVTRKAVSYFNCKYGRNNLLGITLDCPLSDGSTGIAYDLVCGTCIDGKVNIDRLCNELLSHYAGLAPGQKQMLVSDAKVRLGMAYKGDKEYNAKAKPEELRGTIVKKIRHQENSIQSAACPDMSQILKCQANNSVIQHAPQAALKELVYSLKNVLSDIELQCLDEQEYLSAHNIPLDGGFRYPSSFHMLSGLKCLLDAYVHTYAFSVSPQIRTLLHNQI